MRDPVYTSELDNDHGELTDKMLTHALDDLIWRLFDGQKIGSPPWDIEDFLEEQHDCSKLLSSWVLNQNALVNEEIERRLRKYLENSELLLDYANDLEE